MYAYYHLETPPQGATSFVAPITDIDVIYNDDKTPDGYHKINIDLNMGAGGAYIYLCYKLGEPTAESALNGIVDLTVIAGPNSDLNPPYGYTLVKKDLNAGSGGDYVYFAYKKYPKQ